jgi:PAS domain S-box-containing protein
MDQPIPPQPAPSGRRVLIIDDDRDFADSLCNLLTLEGYDVEVGYSAAGALEALDRFPVEVALIDIRLGDEDGLALVTEFRQRREDIVCVIITAYASVESAIQALQEGAYDFLCKPFYPEDLMATLERCFERLALVRGREAAEYALRVRNQELEALNARLKRAVAAMQSLSASSTLQALYTTAVETLAHTMGARNAALYLVDGSEFSLHQALLPGLPLRMPLLDAETLQRQMFVIRTAATEGRPGSSDGASASLASSPGPLLAFPLTSERHELTGLLVLQTDPTAVSGEQDREFGLIVASFASEAIRLLQALDDTRWSEARLREIIDNSPSLISLNDLQGRYLVVNRQFETWHGRRVAEVVGRRPDEVFPSDVARLYEPRSAAALHGNGIVEEETEVVFQDGAAHTVLVTRFPVRDAGGRPIGIGTIATDVTDRRRAEERLRHSDQMEALGQLTGGIAHDFNNLLAVIIGNLDLLREEFGGRDPQRELIEDSLASASSGRELVQRLLAFGRRQRLRPEPTNANTLVLGLSRVLERTLGERIEIQRVLDDDLWPITVDKSQFETSLLNLALNGRDAMTRGGVLTIETRNVVVQHAFGEQETITPGSYVTLTVADTGTGMTPAIAAQALQPFFTTKEAGRGSGLGLSMVYGFVKQSGGYLSIDSKPGGGTSVTLHLPRAEDETVQTRKMAGSGVDLSARGERILIVEDKRVVRKMTKAMLTKLGYAVLEAESTSKALALLQQEPQVHLLLTDVLLSGQANGFDLAAQARRRCPGLKVLFMSGYAASARPQHAEFGASVHVLEKPFTKEALAREVRQALAGEA